MLVKFRGQSVPYQPRLLEPKAPAKNQSLPEFWLGLDTEAAPLDSERDEVQTIQVSDGLEDKLEYVKSGDGFRHFWSIIIRSLPVDVWKKTKSRPITVPVYCHNWEYDFHILIKDAPLPWVEQSKLNHFYPGFEAEVNAGMKKFRLVVEGGHMIGNAPTLTVLVIHTKTNKQVRLRLLDTFPFFPKALGTAAKDLGLQKGDRASLIGIDWRTIPYENFIITRDENGRYCYVNRYMFEDYGKSDSRIVHALGGRIRQLHMVEGLTSLAVSGAGYAAKVLVKRLKTPIYGGHGGRAAVQIALDAFHGGRSGRLVHGQVKDCFLYDFRSSYPSIQIGLPALHSDYTLVYRHNNLPLADFMELARKYHGFARVSGVERDTKYPSLLSANEKGSIRPVVGEFDNIAATAGEIYLGITCGGLEITEVKECIFYAPKAGLEHKKPFEGFIARAWERKSSFEKGTIEYDAAKIQANSGYGKMIEHRGAQTFFADDIQIKLKKTGEEGEVEARNFFLEVHPDYWFEYVEKWHNSIESDYPDPEYIDLKDLLNTQAEFGYYAIPQYAAWITGHAHARLVLLMRVLEAFKWDTDSATTYLNEDKAAARFATITRDLLPDYIQELRLGENLGEIDLEARNMTGVILGNKRYYLEGEVNKEGIWKKDVKEGHHGLPGVDKKVLKPLLNQDETHRDSDGKLFYISKPRPKKIRSTPDLSQVGKFYQKKYNPNFIWNDNQDHTTGEYKPFAGYK